MKPLAQGFVYLGLGKNGAGFSPFGVRGGLRRHFLGRARSNRSSNGSAQHHDGRVGARNGAGPGCLDRERDTSWDTP